MYTYRITTDNEVFTLPNSDLQTLQSAVGGYVELIGNPVGTMYANEEGILMGLAPNAIATAMAGRLIVGDIAITCDTAFFDGMVNERESQLADKAVAQ